MTKPRIIVAGGVVMDLRFEIDELPQSYDSAQGTYREEPGGKGLNQAVACARLGAQTSLISARGDDAHGNVLSEIIRSENVKPLIKVIAENKDVRTDVTAVMMNHGKPSFIGCRRATNELNEDDIRGHRDEIDAADIVLVTFDVSAEAVRGVIDHARRSRKRIIVNASPSTSIDMSYMKDVDYVVLNYVEASSWVQRRGKRHKKSMSEVELGKEILRGGCRSVIVTGNYQGCWVINKKKAVRYGAFPVRALDETGASDAFCAGLAVAIAEKQPPTEQIRFASAAGAYASEIIGAYNSMPREDKLKRYLYERQSITLR